MTGKRKEKPVKEGSKRTKKVMSLENKIKILDRLKAGESIAKVGRSFSVNESTIRYMKKVESQIRSAVAFSTNQGAKIAKVIRDPNIIKMEKALSIWMEYQSQKNVSLNGPAIREKAKRLFGYFSSTQNTFTSFEASGGWFQKFKKRNALHKVDLLQQPTPVEQSLLPIYPPEFLQIIQEEESCQIPSLETETFIKNEKSETNSSFDTTVLTEGLKLSEDLINFFVSVDPLTKRSAKFKNNIENSMSDYRESLRQLEDRSKQIKITHYFGKND